MRFFQIEFLHRHFDERPGNGTVRRLEFGDAFPLLRFTNAADTERSSVPIILLEKLSDGLDGTAGSSATLSYT
jgi:hypothetical protein